MTALVVIELGSGSAKILAQVDGVTVHDESVKTNMVASMGSRTPSSLTAQALANVEDALASFETLVASSPSLVQPVVKVVGCAAVRRAKNVGELSAIVTSRFGVEIDVIDEKREASLALAGAMSGRPISGHVAMIDIGAGSTEVALIVDGVTSSWSLPIGSRTITDDYLSGDPPEAAELSAALSVVELHLEDLRRELPLLGVALEAGTVLGVGALVEVAAVEIGLVDQPDSVDGFVLNSDAAEDVFRTLATESAADRAYNPGLRPEHVNDIVGGLVVLVEFIRQFGVEEIVVSEQGLRHGLMVELAEKARLSEW